MSFFEKIDFLVIGFKRPILVLFVIYIGFLLFGSFCFIMLESNNEIEARNEKMKSIRTTQAMIKYLREANYNDTQIKQAFCAEHKKKVGTIDPENVPWYQKFGEKFFFSFILASTIGYGNVTPKSTIGKCVCILYALIGIPIHAIMMRLISVEYRKGLAMSFKVGLKLIPRSHSRIALIISGFLYFFFMSAIFLLIPPYLIQIIEGWDYIQAFYFGWVSMTTIGLGDYVAGVTDTSSSAVLYILSILLTLLWLFFGAGFVTMAINMLSYVMSVYTLDKFDLDCQPRTEATEKLKDLLDLMRELNWQLVKGKPDDFEKWSEIEDFKNLVAENPEDVTPSMLNRMFETILDLKEKSYNQVYKMQPKELTEIPSSLIRRHATDVEESIPNILSTVSISVNKVKCIDEDTPKALPISQSAAESPATPKHKEDRDVSSHPNFLSLGTSEQESSRVSPGHSTRRGFTDIAQNSIIEDRRNSLSPENEDVDYAAEDVNSDHTDEKSDDNNKRNH